MNILQFMHLQTFTNSNNIKNNNSKISIIKNSSFQSYFHYIK